MAMRLDSYLKDKFGTRSKAASAILRGEVLYGGKIAKPSLKFEDSSLIEILQPKPKFVSNGGYKLEKAFLEWGISAKGLTALDIGASNGGFTDCLLQFGAKFVYALDIGESQLDKSLIQTGKVAVIDNANARDITSDMFDRQIDIITCDLSFISVTKILQALTQTASQNTQLFILIKPQFEAEGKGINKKGIVKNRARRMEILSFVCQQLVKSGLFVFAITAAPLIEGKNIEYIARVKKIEGGEFDTSLLDKLP